VYAIPHRDLTATTSYVKASSTPVSNEQTGRHVRNLRSSI
jgi:hypothetical protein